MLLAVAVAILAPVGALGASSDESTTPLGTAFLTGPVYGPQNLTNCFYNPWVSAECSAREHANTATIALSPQNPKPPSAGAGARVHRGAHQREGGGASLAPAAGAARSGRQTQQALTLRPSSLRPPSGLQRLPAQHDADADLPVLRPPGRRGDLPLAGQRRRRLRHARLRGQVLEPLRGLVPVRLRRER